MLNLKSDKVIINKSAERVFDFLSDFNNFENIMPEQIQDWQSTMTTCEFNIQGLTKLSMKIDKKIPYSKIIIKPNGDTSFDYILTVNLYQLEEDKTEGQLIFDADVNPMLAMMAKKPLKNFINILSEKLKDNLK
ncbi:MAG: SRPBCC family protein [Bacteroidales bacterium]|nr:SRPBCC family protein [Bacteroidales bacterium]